MNKIVGKGIELAVVVLATICTWTVCDRITTARHDRDADERAMKAQLKVHDAEAMAGEVMRQGLSDVSAGQKSYHLVLRNPKGETVIDGWYTPEEATRLAEAHRRMYEPKP
jgi:hypothetical protein